LLLVAEYAFPFPVSGDSSQFAAHSFLQSCLQIQ